MFEIEKRIFKILSSSLFLFQASLFAQEKDIFSNAFIDSEVQFYFENTVGYRQIEKSRNGSFRDSPVSAPAGTAPLGPRNSGSAAPGVGATGDDQVPEAMPTAGEGFLKRALLKDELPLSHLSPSADYKKPNFDNLPLYYDMKIADTAGPISSCVLEPSAESENGAAGYSMVDITIKGENSGEFYRDFMKKIDFFMAGEQDLKEGNKSWKVVFGWLSHESLDTLRTSGLIKGFSFSRRRGFKAPLKDVSLIIKAPANRDFSVFSKAFVEEIKKMGFEEQTSENISGGRNSRFSLIKISGKLPVDKIDSLWSSPFVLKINSNI